jgi:hypothetical protein
VCLALSISPQNVVLRHPKPVSQDNLGLGLQQTYPMNIAGIHLEPFPSNQTLLDLYMPQVVNEHSSQPEQV